MQLILWCFQFFQGAYTGKDHSQAHAHVHADDVHDHACGVHDHAGEDKIILITQAHAHVHVDAGEDHLVGMLSIGGPSISAARAVSSNKCPL